MLTFQVLATSAMMASGYTNVLDLNAGFAFCSPTAYLLPSHDYLLPSHDYLLPSHDYLLPSHDYLLPSHDYLLPSHDYLLPTPDPSIRLHGEISEKSCPRLLDKRPCEQC